MSAYLNVKKGTRYETEKMFDMLKALISVLGQGFSLATRKLNPWYSHGKIAENRTKRNLSLFDPQ